VALGQDPKIYDRSPPMNIVYVDHKSNALKRHCKPLRSVTRHGIAQCYLLPDTSERTPPSPEGWYSIYRPLRVEG